MEGTTISYYVYEDVARTKKVLAKNIMERNRGIVAYVHTLFFSSART